MSPDEEALARDTLERARAQFGASLISRRMGGITPQAISRWKVVPPRRALAFHEATGFALSEIRPDVYRRAVRR